jgi:hypothetical protein
MGVRKFKLDELVKFGDQYCTIYRFTNTLSEIRNGDMHIAYDLYFADKHVVMRNVLERYLVSVKEPEWE